METFFKVLATIAFILSASLGWSYYNSKENPSFTQAQSQVVKQLVVQTVDSLKYPTFESTEQVYDFFVNEESQNVTYKEFMSIPIDMITSIAEVEISKTGSTNINAILNSYYNHKDVYETLVPKIEDEFQHYNPDVKTETVYIPVPKTQTINESGNPNNNTQNQIANGIN